MPSGGAKGKHIFENVFSVLCIVRALDFESRIKESDDNDLSSPALAQQNFRIPESIMNKELDIHSTGQHWKKDGDYWCSFDYNGVLTVVKCRWYGKNQDVLNFEFDPSKEKSIKNVPVEWFDDAEYFEYVPVINLSKEDFKVKR